MIQTTREKEKRKKGNEKKKNSLSIETNKLIWCFKIYTIQYIFSYNMEANES